MFAISWLEAIAALLGVIYIYGVTLERPWAWLAALISTALYTYIFWEHALSFSALLNAYYMLMALYGYWCWTRGSHAKVGDIKYRSYSWHLLYMIVGVSSILAICAFQQMALSSLATLDIVIMVFSVMTTVLVAHKHLANWIYWIVINSLAIVLYWQYELWFTVCLYIVYWGFSVNGLWQWRIRSMRS